MLSVIDLKQFIANTAIFMEYPKLFDLGGPPGHKSSILHDGMAYIYVCFIFVLFFFKMTVKDTCEYQFCESIQSLIDCLDVNDDNPSNNVFEKQHLHSE